MYLADEMPEKLWADDTGMWTTDKFDDDTAYHRDDIVRQLAAALVAMDDTNHCSRSAQRANALEQVCNTHASVIAAARKIIGETE